MLRHASEIAENAASAVATLPPHRPETALRITQRGRVALQQLLEAWQYARELNRSVWDFSLSIEALHNNGLSNNDLRWLLCQDLVEQAWEVEDGTFEERTFRTVAPLMLGSTSCLVLTAAGEAFVRHYLEQPGADMPPPGANVSASGMSAAGNGARSASKSLVADTSLSNASHGAGGTNGLAAAGPEDIELAGGGSSSGVSNGAATPKQNAAAGTASPGNGALNLPPHVELAKPIWDRDRQELRLAQKLIKQYKVPAPNQEIILAVFHEEGWPVRIDDPLPPHPEVEPKRRLHDTINSLNRNQKASLIRFQGDGSGQGVRWELTREGKALLGSNGHH